MSKAGKNARQVQIRECFPQPLKERLDKGREMRRGKSISEIDIFFVFNRKRRRPRMAYGASYLKALFRPRWYDCRALSSFRPLAYWDSSLRALPALSNNQFRLGPGKRWQQQKGRGPCSCCARPPLSQWGSRFGIYYKKKRESTSDNHASARAACGMAESGPFWIYNPSRE